MIETEVTFLLVDVIEHDGNWFREAIHEHLASQHNVYDVDGVRFDVQSLHFLIDGPALTFYVSGHPINETG